MGVCLTAVLLSHRHDTFRGLHQGLSLGHLRFHRKPVQGVWSERTCWNLTEADINRLHSDSPSCGGTTLTEPGLGGPSDECQSWNLSCYLEETKVELIRRISCFQASVRDPPLWVYLLNLKSQSHSHQVPKRHVAWESEPLTEGKLAPDR